MYVDDVIVIGTYLDGIKKLKSIFDEQFNIKNLGKLKYFLGIEVGRLKERIYICQRKYVIDLLTEVGLIGSKPLKIPLDQNLKLFKHKDELLSNPLIYRRLVGKLMYLTITRLDLPYYVQQLSQFMEKPRNKYI